MALGTHWEWRAFGRLSQRFLDTFNRFPLVYPAKPWDRTTDEYIWIPGSTINVKIRSGGAEEGLKLKRFVRKDGPLELWSEDSSELYPFSSFDDVLLKHVATTLEVRCPEVHSGLLTRAEILAALQAALPPAEVVTVDKERQSRKFNANVNVEVAQIKEVKNRDKTVLLDDFLYSVSMESSADHARATPEEMALAGKQILDCLQSLDMASDKLTTMNYLQAIESWLRMRYIAPSSR